MSMETLFGVSDIARMTGRKVVTVHQWITKGFLRAQKIGKTYVVREVDYQQFVNDRRERGFKFEEA